MPELTGWDYMVLIVLGLSVLFGLLRGFVRTIFALTAWAVALIGTPIAAPYVLQAGVLKEYPWVVYIVLFVALFVLVRLVGQLIARGLKKVGLGGADRFLGGLLGLARAVLVITVIAVAARWAGMDQSVQWQRAVSRPLLEHLVFLVEPYLPESFGGLKRT